MSGRIETILSVDTIRVKAHHGWYEAERKLGGMYKVSINVYDTVNANEDFAEISDTINYEEIYDNVLGIMRNEYKLIEQCCRSLWDVLKPLKPEATWEVILEKEDVPIKHLKSTRFTIKA